MLTNPTILLLHPTTWYVEDPLTDERPSSDEKNALWNIDLGNSVWSLTWKAINLSGSNNNSISCCDWFVSIFDFSCRIIYFRGDYRSDVQNVPQATYMNHVDKLMYSCSCWKRYLRESFLGGGISTLYTVLSLSIFQLQLAANWRKDTTIYKLEAYCCSSHLGPLGIFIILALTRD